MQLTEEKLREINQLKVTQAELQQKAAEEMTDLKKAQDHLIVEQAQLCARCSEVEQAISDACQNIFYNTARLTPVEKAKRLGKNIVQLQDTNLMLNALVQPAMPLE